MPAQIIPPDQESPAPLASPVPETTAQGESASPAGSPSPSPDQTPEPAFVPETKKDPQIQGMKILYDLGFEVVMNMDPEYPVVAGDYLTTLDESGRGTGSISHLVVKEVRAGKIFALVAWTSRPIREGESVVRVNRPGIDISTAFSTVLKYDDQGAYSDIYLEPALRLTWAWGLFGFRPALRVLVPLGTGIESTFPDNSGWLPLGAGLDFEYSLYLDRFRLQPFINVTGLAYLPLASQEAVFAGMRVEGGFRVCLGFDQGSELYLEAGYLRHFGDQIGYNGALHLGLGFTFK